MASAGESRTIGKALRRRIIWIVGILLAFVAAVVYFEKSSSRQLPVFLKFLDRYEQVSLSIERVPSGYGENLPHERSVEVVYSVSFDYVVDNARVNVEQSSFREEPFPLPEWIVFRCNDGRFVGLVPTMKDRSLTTVVYVRPGTFLERCFDTIGL